MEKTKNREQWRLVIEEAKAHPGLYSREDGGWTTAVIKQVFTLLQTAFIDKVFRLRFKVLIAVLMKVKVYWNVMMHQLGSSHYNFQSTVLSTTTQQSTWCNISQDLNLQVFQCM